MVSRLTLAALILPPAIGAALEALQGAPELSMAILASTILVAVAAVTASLEAAAIISAILGLTLSVIGSGWSGLLVAGGIAALLAPTGSPVFRARDYAPLAVSLLLVAVVAGLAWRLGPGFPRGALFLWAVIGGLTYAVLSTRSGASSPALAVGGVARLVGSIFARKGSLLGSFSILGLAILLFILSRHYVQAALIILIALISWSRLKGGDSVIPPLIAAAALAYLYGLESGFARLNEILTITPDG